MSTTDLPSTPHLLERHWPLPALMAWALAWAAFAALRAAGVSAPLALGLAALLPVVPAWPLGSRWRQGLLVGGFPLSALMLGAGSAVPAWVWLLPLVLLLLLYPVRAWRDAPVFPTAPEALAGLDAALPLPPGARILDAGSGLGHGLQALHAVWPLAQIEGLEHSAPLAWLSRLRCPWARVQRGDMWAHAWGTYQLVYLFQRPESMARAWQKACAEMAPGAWVASLEFEIPGVEPVLVLRHPGQRPLLIYRLGGSDRPVPAQPGRPPADKTPTTAHVRVAG
jgi:hypothetical protein